MTDPGLVLVPEQELRELRERVAALEAARGAVPDVDPIAAQFAAFQGRVKDLERQGKA